MLNYNEFFDLQTELASSQYSPISKLDRANYISSTARHFKYNYEDDNFPSDEVICDLFRKAIPRLKRKQLEVGVFEDIHLIFDLPSGSFGVIDLKQLEFCKVEKIEEIKNYQRFKLDPRLLKRALTGPHLANWNNIEIGAHLDFDRQPDVFRHDIHILVNALHV